MARSARWVLGVPQSHATVVVRTERRGDDRPRPERDRCQHLERRVQLAASGPLTALQVPHLDAAAGRNGELGAERRQPPASVHAARGMLAAPGVVDRRPQFECATVPGGGEADRLVVEADADQLVDLVTDVALRMWRLREAEHLLSARRGE